MNAQTCVLSPNNSSSNPNVSGNFNWLSPSFPIKWADASLVNINPITSPFFQNNNAGLNYIIFGQNYSYNDGWELLQKNASLGDANGTAISHPYMIFYNRFTGLLRAFLSINTRNNAYQKANVEMYFSGEGETSGVLSTVGYPVALDKATNKSLHSVVNAKNTPGDWFVAEFPMSYDPCTCKNYSEIIFKISSTQQSKLTGTIVTNGTLTPQEVAPSDEKKITLGNISLKEASNLGKNAMEAYNSMDKFKTEMLKTHDQKWEKIGVDIFARPNPKTPNGAIGLQATLSTLKTADQTGSKLDQLVTDTKSRNFLKGGLSALPYISTALSIIDFFTGGGGAASGPQEVKLTPMAIKMTSELTGEIQRTDQWSDIIISNPGSDQSSLPSRLTPNILAERKPFYNNTMGIFNLLKTPKVAYRRRERVIPFSVRQDIYTQLGGFLANRRAYNKTVYDYDFKPIYFSEKDFIVNPAHGMKIQDIKGSIVIEGQISDFDLLKNGLGNGNLTFDSFDATEKTYGFRTEYADWKCLSLTTARTSDIWIQDPNETLDTEPFMLTNLPEYSAPVLTKRAEKNVPFRGWQVDKAGIDAGKNRVFLKLIINFKRTDDPNAQNVLWVGKFPVELIERGWSIPQNGTFYVGETPFGFDLGKTYQQIEATWNTTSVGCAEPPTDLPYDQLPNPKNINVDAFCSSSEYLKNTKRSGRIAASQFPDWDNNGGGCSYTDGQTLFTFYGEVIEAKICNGTLYAKAIGGAVKSRTWLVGAGMNAIAAACFAENDPTLNGCTTTGGGTGGNTGNGTSPSNCSAGNFSGNVDVLNCNQIAGWCFDNNDFSRTVKIDIFSDGQYVTTVDANQNRSDLGTAFNNPAAIPHGFSYSVPNSDCWKNGQNHLITVKPCGGTGNITNGSQNLSCAGTGLGTCGTITAGGGSCNYTDGQFLFNFYSESIEARFCNGTLYARAIGGAFKPRWWLIGAGMDATAAACFAENNPGCVSSSRVANNESEDEKMEVYPNPSSGKIKVGFSLQQAENVWVNLIDSQGRSLQLNDFEGKTGRNLLDLDLQNYPTGTYFINLQSSQKREVQKVVKVE